MATKITLHLVSPASGDVVEALARTLVAQFADVALVRHFWQMVVAPADVERVLEGVADKGGMVLHSVIDDDIRALLEAGCGRLGAPCLFVFEPFRSAIAEHFDAAFRERAGPRVVIDDAYTRRLEAMRYALAHDDGIGEQDLEQADVILMGVSRVTKTPTCMYLAHRGIKAANVSLLAGRPLPDAVLKATRPLKVGLTLAPQQLAEIRRARFHVPKGANGVDYSDIDAVKEELLDVRRKITRQGWPVIDITRRSIDRTAAMIMTLLQRHQEGEG
ncbi:MAG: pyruvate, phosphate dikinase/phosphoenolpyruvate synthase regulator [Rhodobacterales bacterium]|nr:pyruvate, phosphate dikinase/phosphoenolpyruvate synthase regulator [Rhodobacterales bacterium]